MTSIEKNVLDFYSELICTDNNRYKSWEHCYQNFQSTFNKKSLTKIEIDFLSVHLAFYLASWGMYRGSSFLLERDYKIFYPIVELLFLEKEFFTESTIEDMLKQKDEKWISEFIERYFHLDKKLELSLEKIRKSVKGEINTPISYTLKSKILLGTFGCIPAYDRFFINGIKINNMDYHITQKYSKKSLRDIMNFIQDNLEIFISTRTKISQIQNESKNLNKIKYPIMKLIDMYFWKIGFDQGK
ncbi:hypothetical protein [Flammeovirga aprica]|uniref:Uncharacterized protein n=1 Tax=Flammeovirga aprica JL-4 TaxID=694437 RepID=A0A7X9XBB4_9BACT|nr:hypothetical protein [Flammeovirga aprica]NME70557.1 hypothetical protein [Flammeovirga aprica JL-4]